MLNNIEIRGAREHNLKNISVDIPKNKLIAITGPSGSGKSTFAFDILQRECQRQYMESMGMVTDGMNKANVESIMGLSPSISISQGITNRSPRSTLGTYTEILTYIRLLYAKCGKRICQNCQATIEPEFLSHERSRSEDDEKEMICPYCETRSPALTMAHFSFNKVEGYCESCHGIGEINEIDPKSMVNEELSIGAGAVQMWQGIFAQHYEGVLKNLAAYYKLEFDVAKAIKEYNELESIIFYKGVKSPEFTSLYPDIKPPKRVTDGYFEGILTYLQKKSAENIQKGSSNSTISKCFVRSVCPECHGDRLNKQAREVLLDNKTIMEISSYTLDDLLNWTTSLHDRVTLKNKKVLDAIVSDISKRIKRISEIGLGYLTLERTISTLSGGEAQRLRLANLLDSGLTGVLYILDEPTAGLHANDTLKILNALKVLVEMGNTVVVIEHDMDFVKQCDYVIDFGPYSGKKGGEIVAKGSPQELMNFGTLTSQYMNVEVSLDQCIQPESINELIIEGASAHNLKNINVKIPLNNLVSITGVSGSGKSTLIFDVLVDALNGRMVNIEKLEGFEDIDQVIKVTQQRIGRSSRSTVATYTGMYTAIRTIFANQNDAKLKNRKASDFSFNVKGGRCEKCLGLGSIPLNMHFLDDIEVECPACHGNRFNHDVLEILFKGFTISDILNQTVQENMAIFKEHKDVYQRLNVLSEVGLDYLTLGQSTSTLSGGECQRIKVSKELGRSKGTKILYILDEPTVGLHPSDIDKLMLLLKKLVKRGNSVILIEHALEVISKSDWIIDLGPEGGSNGGEVVASGTPYQISQHKKSVTGRFLQEQ